MCTAITVYHGLGNLKKKSKNLFFNNSERLKSKIKVLGGRDCLVRAAVYLQDGSSRLCPLEGRGLVSSDDRKQKGKLAKHCTGLYFNGISIV